MRYLLTTTAVILALPCLALADDAPTEVGELIVIGHSKGYVATDSVTATKTDTPLINVPQTISVVTRAQMDDQAFSSLGEVLRYVPGTTVGQGEGNRDQITLRGQNTTADFFLDGVRDDTQYYRGLYNLDRVEILKGPSALIFGRGGGGGIVNRVQKTPRSNGFFASTRASLNSFGAYDVSADVNAPIGDKAAVRLNAMYETLEGHRDYSGGERYALNPYLALDLGKGWSAGLSYEYVNDDRVADRGVPALAGVPIRGYRDQFFGVPGANRTTLEAHIAKLRIDGALAENLDWSTTLLYGDYDKFYANVYANGSATSQNGTVALGSYSDPTERQNFVIQSNLVWDTELGGITHKVLFGLEYGDQDSKNRRFNGTLSNAAFNLANPVFPSVTFSTLSRDTVSNVKAFSVYGQDQVGLGSKFNLVVGLRYDRFEIEGVDLQPNPDRVFGRRDEKVSPRVGLIYKPQENVSFYASFSRSFLPRSGDQFLTLSTTQQNLEPESFTNHEVGLKWDIRPNLNLTVAAFQLERSNATTPDPLNPLVTINVGTTQTKGFEVGLAGNIRDNWQISGGYAYQDATLEGNRIVRLGQVPKQQLTLWNRYDLSENLAFGLGVVHQAGQYAAIRTSTSTTKLPAFTRVDAAVYYQFGSSAQLQLNIDNVFDVEYFSDAHNNNNISTGAPRNARITVKRSF